MVLTGDDVPVATSSMVGTRRSAVSDHEMIRNFKRGDHPLEGDFFDRPESDQNLARSTLGQGAPPHQHPFDAIVQSIISNDIAHCRGLHHYNVSSIEREARRSFQGDRSAVKCAGVASVSGFGLRLVVVLLFCCSSTRHSRSSPHQCKWGNRTRTFTL